MTRLRYTLVFVLTKVRADPAFEGDPELSRAVVAKIDSAITQLKSMDLDSKDAVDVALKAAKCAEEDAGGRGFGVALGQLPMTHLRECGHADCRKRETKLKEFKRYACGFAKPGSPGLQVQCLCSYNILLCGTPNSLVCQVSRACRIVSACTGRPATGKSARSWLQLPARILRLQLDPGVELAVVSIQELLLVQGLVLVRVPDLALSLRCMHKRSCGDSRYTAAVPSPVPYEHGTHRRGPGTRGCDVISLAEQCSWS